MPVSDLRAEQEPTSEGSRAEFDGPFEAASTVLVSYMLPQNWTPKSPKFSAHRSLLIAGESPLSRLPSYSARYSPSCPESSLAGRSAGYPERNLENYLVCYSVSYRAGYLEENSASYSESCRESNCENSPSDCPENCPASSSESNLPSNGADNLPSYSESNPADSPASCLGSFGQGPAASPGRRAVVRSPRATPHSPTALPSHNDLGS